MTNIQAFEIMRRYDDATSATGVDVLIIHRATTLPNIRC